MFTKQPKYSGRTRSEHSTDTGTPENRCYRDRDHVRHVVKMGIDRHAISSVPTGDSRLAHGFQPLYARDRRRYWSSRPHGWAWVSRELSWLRIAIPKLGGFARLGPIAEFIRPEPLPRWALRQAAVSHR
jgi:hypothetical protein